MSGGWFVEVLYRDGEGIGLALLVRDAVRRAVPEAGLDVWVSRDPGCAAGTATLGFGKAVGPGTRRRALEALEPVLSSPEAAALPVTRRVTLPRGAWARLEGMAEMSGRTVEELVRSAVMGPPEISSP